jgi:hypothetical protein
MKKITFQKWRGGFGNNIMQLSNAIEYSLNNNYAFESLDHPLINKFTVNSHILYREIESKHYKDFFYHGCKNRYKIIEEFIKPNLKNIITSQIKKIESNTVVISIRSGDIFEINNRKLPLQGVQSYVQNPLSYFKKIINMYEKAIVVYQNESNPIIEHLSKLKNVQMESNDFPWRIARVLSAQNLCLSGYSTFGPMCCMLSNNLNKLHVTNLTTGISQIQKHIEIDLTNIDLNRYIKIGDWKNTEEQRSLMINFEN